YNLGAVGLLQAVRQARGQQKTARGALLPNIFGDLTGATEKVNLAAFGITQVGNFQLPTTVVAPFNLVDLRAKLSQTVFDLTAWHNYRAATESARASELTSEDSRDLVVLAVAGAYLQAVAARARVASARAQIETANALFQQASERRAVGLVAQVD